MKSPSTTPYYLLQSACWCVFSLMHVLFSAMYMPLNSATIINGVFIGMTGLLTTHLLRTAYRTRAFNLKKPKALIVRALACVLLATLLWEGLIIVLHMGILQYYSLDTISWAAAGFWYYYYCIALSLWSLAYFVVKIIRQRREDAIEKLHLEIALRDAELQSLKWQMNPHFLFNALNSVRALISEDSERAKSMVTQMAQLLRYALSSPEHKTVPLAQELAATETYLALEQVRFEERLVYRIEADEACLDLPMLPMCLQTLVENAVKHGIARLPAGGKIEVQVSRTAKGLCIQVINTGTLSEPIIFGTGLGNTQARIALVFGSTSSLTLSQMNPNTVLTTLDLELTE